MATRENVLQDFPPEIKSQKRRERFQKVIPQGSFIEIHHIQTLYCGGKCEEENAIGLTRAKHAHKHFTDAHDPCPVQNSMAEWVGTRYIIGRMNLDEFTDSWLGIIIC